MDLTIKHKPGKGNGNADALSRSPEVNQIVADPVEAASLSENDLSIPSTDTVRESQLRDSELLVLLNYLEEGVLPEDD